MIGSASDFIHRFIPATTETPYTLLLLHGTGGSEESMVPLGQELLPGAAILSPRGKALEGGDTNRFFRRHAEGVLDLEDLRFRTTELAAFVREAAAYYGVDPARVAAVGYSNGANIAASLLLQEPGTLAAAVLFHPMVPFEPDPLPDLSGVPVFIGAGRTDPLVEARNTQRLADLLTEAGAGVTLRWQEGGHQISREEADAAREWLAQR